MNSEKQPRRIMFNMEIAVFDIPPCRDVLAIGRNAPIGKNAAKKMLDTIAPDRFDIVDMEGEVVEAILVRRGLLKLIGKKNLERIVRDSIAPLMLDTSLLHITMNAKLLDTRIIEVEDEYSP